MKKMIIVLMSLLMVNSALATSNVDKLIKVSTDLEKLNQSLSETESEVKSETVKVVISTALGTYLGVKSYELLNRKAGGSMGGVLDGALGVLGTMVTVVVVSYGGYQAYQLTIDVKAIPKLKKAIEMKRQELEATRRLLQDLE